MKIRVYGDSLLLGVREENGKYLIDKRWEKGLAEAFSDTIKNCSRFGCVMKKLLPTLRKDSQIPGDEVVVLEMGGNDCDFYWDEVEAAPDEEHLCKTPPELFEKEYREAVRLIKESGRRPVLTTLPPVHSERYLKFICRNGLSAERILHWLGDVQIIYRWQKKYSELIKKIAKEEKVPLFDLRSAFPEDQDALEPYMCSDGVHPSEAGQRLIYEAFAKEGLAPVLA